MITKKPGQKGFDQEIITELNKLDTVSIDLDKISDKANLSLQSANNAATSEQNALSSANNSAQSAANAAQKANEIQGYVLPTNATYSYKTIDNKIKTQIQMSQILNITGV